MSYIKISIKLVPNEEWFRDILAVQLGEAGFESFMESEDGLEAFIPERSFDEASLQTVLSGQPASFRIQWEKEEMEDKNWNEEWEKNYFQPLLIGEECVIRAPFHKSFPKARYEIIIEPNMAFGTGNHETTSMMLEAILAEDLSGKTVLDMGCGTGILGILASKKGASKITAADISEWAVSGTKENAALNHIQNIQVHWGDAALPVLEQYDFIFANIHKNVLMEDLPAYNRFLYPGGIIFLSGFYLHDLEDIKKRAQGLGLQYIGHQVRKEWVVATVKKPA